MDTRIYWLWLSNLPNMSSVKITNLLAGFNSVEEIYKSDNYSGTYGINEQDIKNLMNKSLDTANKIIDKLRATNAGILTYDDAAYPDMLRQLPDPPYVLYIKGEVMKWDRLLTIAAVGTRRFNDYGKRVCENICSELARAGVTIVSGMARGLDSVAAVSALNAGAKTIAVLGCGIDIVYPAENENLMNAIAHQGAVLTEYPPGTPPVSKHFPQRNRIISGLSYGTLVTQAPLHSGALITANYALDTGKDVFSVPGNIYDIMSQGNNMLIKSGAKLVENARDILEEYDFEAMRLRVANNIGIDEILKDTPSEKSDSSAHKSSQVHKSTHIVPINNVMNVSIDDERYKSLEGDERMIIELLIEDAMHIDDIVRKSNLTMGTVNSVLTILEMKSLVKQMPGKNFRLNIQNHI